MKLKEDSHYGIKFLLHYIKPYKKTIWLIIFSMIGVAITSALTAYIMKPILNDIFVNRDEQMMIVIPLLIILLFVSRGIFRFLSAYLSNSIGIDITNKIRSEMFNKAVHANYEAIQSKTIGDINAHIIQTVLNLRNMITSTIPTYVTSVLTVIALMVAMFAINWKLSLFAIVFGLGIVKPIKYLGKKVKSHVLGAEKMVSGLSDIINETFGHLDLVKVYNNTDMEKRRFDTVLDRYSKFQLKLSKYKELTSPIMEFFIALAVAFVVYAGGQLVIHDEIMPGDFFAFLTALMMLYAPVKVVSKNALILNILDTYIKRIENILHMDQEMHVGDTINESIESIAFENVSLAIGDKEILDNISFQLDSKKTLAIVGKTGAGKSSILTLLFGFRKPSKGTIYINGKPLLKYNLSSIRDEISYINQNSGIFNVTVKENILYGLKYDKARYERAILLSHCDFIKTLPDNDDYVAGENGNRLSGGQRQRLSLARAIYKDSSLFVLDEATSALDADTEQKIYSQLSPILHNRLSIVIAHKVSTIREADIVMVLSEGKIAEIGDYATVSKTVSFKKNFALKRADG